MIDFVKDESFILIFCQKVTHDHFQIFPSKINVSKNEVRKIVDIFFLADIQKGNIIILLYLIWLLRSNKEDLYSQKEASNACWKLFFFFLSEMLVNTL